MGSRAWECGYVVFAFDLFSFFLSFCNFLCLFSSFWLYLVVEGIKNIAFFFENQQNWKVSKEECVTLSFFN